jgi:uridylate kinase
MHTYRRILLKISGEALAGTQGKGFCPDTLSTVADDIKKVHSYGIQIALVIGAGNLFRGLSVAGETMNRVSADYIGMLGTVMNALALAEALRATGIETDVQSAVEMPRICGRIQPHVAVKALEAGHVVVFAGGTGNPFFSTDSTAALRGAEIKADVIMKATKVDGVYSADPVTHPDAERFDFLSYDEVLARKLKVMDLTAITLCRENKLPVIVFDMTTPGNIAGVLRGDVPHTRIEDTE